MTYISLSNNYVMFVQGIKSDSYNIQIKNIFLKYLKYILFIVFISIKRFKLISLALKNL
jgi:hypothetical protein